MDQRVVEGRTIQIVNSGSAHQVVVDGRVVATDADDDRVQISGVFQGQGKTYILVSEQSGGNACPSLYQAIDLSAGVTLVSPQFGNCSDIPRVAVSNGTLRVSVPGFRAARAGTYTFRDGNFGR